MIDSKDKKILDILSVSGREPATSISDKIGMSVPAVIDRIKELYPVVKNEDLVGGVYMPKDGQADPVGVTNVLAKAGKILGIQIFEKLPVKKILVKTFRNNYLI